MPRNKIPFPLQPDFRNMRSALRQRFALPNRIRLQRQDASLSQEMTFFKLLQKARDTAFGTQYDFKEILKSEDPIAAFRRTVPLCDYDGMRPWWSRAEGGEQDVAWPGRIRYFALSSGTSGAPSKHIPVTKDLIRATRTASIRQLLSLRRFDLGPQLLRRKILTLSGSTTLQDFGHHFKGDVSGINVRHLPRLARTMHKPGKKISGAPDWDVRLKMMVEQAPKWDIGIVAGVPAWLDILLEKIIETYDLENIHDIWPHFSAYIHGGVAIAPYRKKLQRHFGKPVAFAETYLASEGFIAVQTRPDSAGMELMLSNGIYYEFIPFTEENFDENGQLRDPFTATLGIGEIRRDTPYALVMSTCAGAWRYLIGDVVRLVSPAPPEIVIDGRTKHFLSLCGEHLSVDNMTQGISLTADELGVNIPEFTVTGVPHEGRFAHKWYVACDRPVDPEQVREVLDRHLKALNDDYVVERQHALKYMFVEVLPNKVFIDYLEHLGKAGGQSKFPRVLKGEQFRRWEEFLAQR